LYSFKDVLVLKVVKGLLDTGVELQNIRVAVEYLRRREIQDLARVTLFSDGTTVYECSSPVDVVDLLQGAQGVFGIAVSAAMREINSAIKDFPPEKAEGGSVTVTDFPENNLNRRRARRIS
jgi:DNA-binding transcriptional MerR regulator